MDFDVCAQVGSSRSESQQGSPQSSENVVNTTCRVRGTFLSWEPGDNPVGTSRLRSQSEGDQPRSEPLGTRSRSWTLPGEVDHTGSHSGDSGSTGKQGSLCASPTTMFGATPQPSPVFQPQEACKEVSLPLLDLNNIREPERNFSTPEPKNMQTHCGFSMLADNDYSSDLDNPGPVHLGEIQQGHSGRSSPRSDAENRCSMTPPSHSSGGDTGGSPDVHASDAAIGETGIPQFGAMSINTPTALRHGASGFDSMTPNEFGTQVQQLTPVPCLPRAYSPECMSTQSLLSGVPTKSLLPGEPTLPQLLAWQLQQGAVSPTRQHSPSHQPVMLQDGTVLIPTPYASPVAAGPYAHLMTQGQCLTPACAYTQGMPGFLPEFPSAYTQPSQQMGMPAQSSSDVVLPPAVASVMNAYNHAFAMQSTPPPLQRLPDPAALTPPREARRYLDGLFHVAVDSTMQIGRFDHHVFWLVDGKKLLGTERQCVSSPFCLPHLDADGNEVMVTYKLMLHPKAIHLRKKGGCFKTAKGKGTIELKCEGPFEPFNSSVDLTFRFLVGSADPQKMQGVSRPVAHDFKSMCTAGLPSSNDQDIWDFAKSVDDASQKFIVCLKGDGLISRSGAREA